jgi:hypothetical protein
VNSDYRHWQLKFYADCAPQRVKNKFFAFYVVDGRAAARLLDRFLFNEYRFRAAWMVYRYNDKYSVRIPDKMLDLLAQRGFEHPFVVADWGASFPVML